MGGQQTQEDEQAAIVRVLAERLALEDRLTAAWLFGSAARGTMRPDSDVDLALLGTPRPRTLAETPFGLAAQLASSLGREVDVVRLEDADPDLIVRVLRDGILLVDRDRAARLRFEVDARNRYYDMQPIWRQYRRSGQQG